MKLIRTCLLLLLMSSHFAGACNCAPLKPISLTQLEAYHAVFKGVVDSVVKHVVYFEVQQAYKGKLTQQLKLIFDDSSNCRMTFAKKDTWLIYAHFKSYGNLQVDFCSHSRKYFPDASKDYYQATSQFSFEDELVFLNKMLGLQPLYPLNNNYDITAQKPELIQPSSYNKIGLLIISLLFFLSVILLFKKYF